MAENNLAAIAFPRLNEAQLTALGSCPFTALKRYRDGDRLFHVGEPQLQVLRHQVGLGRNRGRIRRVAEDHRRAPSPGSSPARWRS